MTRRVIADDFASFRAQARALVAASVAPDTVLWCDPSARQGSLLEGLASEEPAPLPDPCAQPTPRVPRRFIELAEHATAFRADDRFALAYRVLYRLSHGAPKLLEDTLDDDVRLLERRAKAVVHDLHHMHAFVRFRRTELDGAARFVAWYRPAHLIVKLGAPFFARRFSDMHWTILTPDVSVGWDGAQLHYGPGAGRDEAPAEDALEELFRTYYRATYNPARANLRLFRQHVPAGFQAGMPELTVLSELAAEQANALATEQSGGHTGEAAAARVPASRALETLRSAAARCLACPLGELATQTVFGEGTRGAKLCLVGEQPGNDEDLAGKPFVGPAGKVLDRALAEAGIVRADVYLTNAVKHFGFRPLGKKRLHQKPEWQHVEACRPWLRAELEAVEPAVILCLGATAAQSFLGRRFTVTKNRGRVFETPWARAFVVTYHPSAILRMPSEEARDEAYGLLLSDLKLAFRIAHGEPVQLRRP